MQYLFFDFLQLFADAAAEGGADSAFNSSAETEEIGNNAENGDDGLGAQSINEEFERLIKGKYSSAFAKKTQGIIDKRFAKYKESEKTADALKPVVEHLRIKYPELKNKTLNELVAAFTAENGIENTYGNKAQQYNGDADVISGGNKSLPPDSEPSAEKTGLTQKSETAAEKTGLTQKSETAAASDEASDAANGNNGSEAYLPPLAVNSVLDLGQKAASEAVKNSWLSDSERVKSIYPDFSLDNEIRTNPEFCTLLKAGVPLIKAYECANLGKIMSAAMRYALESAGRKMAGAIGPQTGRPQENGVLDRATSFAKTNVSSLTEKEIMSIIDKVSRGAKITFK